MGKDFARELDVVAYGASGFVGRIVAESLAKTAAGTAGGAPRWALAGKDLDQLGEARSDLGLGDEVPLLRADADDPASLEAMARRTEVVLTTVGPYAKLGSNLVAACVAAGSGYLDLNGEPLWMRAMIDAHEGAAKASGARIVFSCGYDSIPFECGVTALQELCVERWGRPASRVGARVLGTKGGGFSGGTTASLRGERARADVDSRLRELLDDPFALTPGFAGPPQPEVAGALEDPLVGRWVAPHVMAPINVKNVHRSNMLGGHRWGRDFRYDEAVVAKGEGARAREAAEKIAATDRIGREGDDDPSKSSPRERPKDGFFRVLLVGEDAERGKLSLLVEGDADPGYGATAKMVAAAARCLALDGPWPAGIWTPAALMGGKLIRRLSTEAGLRFTPEPTAPEAA